MSIRQDQVTDSTWTIGFDDKEERSGDALMDGAGERYRTLTTWLRGSLWLCGMVALLSFGCNLCLLLFLHGLEEGTVAEGDGMYLLVDKVIALKTLGAPVSILVTSFASVLSLRWFYLSHGFGRQHGLRLQQPARSTVMFYFIPVLNLWKPYLALREVFNEAVPCSGSRWLLPVWWGCWVLFQSLSWLAFRLVQDTDELVALMDMLLARLLADGAALPLLIMFMLVVRRLGTALLAMPSRAAN
ncbi:DUF4328 domain-containing protein [Pokkaliibacter plantistimulans]|nr:DUF4328 domain-containing protein [Pokkaliibacter plantistimulans]